MLVTPKDEAAGTLRRDILVISATLERLADPYVRSRIRQKIAEVGFNNFGQIESWADIRIAISPRGAAEPGRTIEEIARERRCDPLDAVCDDALSSADKVFGNAGSHLADVTALSRRVAAVPEGEDCRGIGEKARGVTIVNNRRRPQVPFGWRRTAPPAVPAL